MRYISLFSGIGGLEAAEGGPLYLCESDPSCAVLLAKVYPNTPIFPDIRGLPSIRADVCAAGWPCQDITVAGRQAGIRGSNSSLFFKMVDVAVHARAHTIVGENVPNLLRLRGGHEFRTVLKSLTDVGFPYVAWRSLNAREFGLPQDRERVVLVASKKRSIALALHRPIRSLPVVGPSPATSAAGFYWTGGARSVCYSEGYVPALKVGASPPKGGTSPVAVFYDKTVRKLSVAESLRLQGFDPTYFAELIPGSVFRMAGNAVPRPMGAFAVESAAGTDEGHPAILKANGFERHGLLARGKLCGIRHETHALADNLNELLDRKSRDSLSAQAAAGLLARIIVARKEIPIPLFDVLYDLSTVRTKLRGTKIDSFKILHEQLDPRSYRARILGRQCAIGGLI